MPYGSVKVDSIVGSNKTLTTDNVVTTSDSGTVTSAMIADGAVVNADINASAAIAHSKLATITAGSVLMGNATGVPTATAISGDITLSNTGVASIATGAIVDAEISASAAITHSKLASITAGSVLMGNATNVPTATALSGDVTISSSGVTAIGASTVTNTMLAGSIANAKLANSTISGVALGSTLNALTLGTGLTGTSYNGSAAVTAAVSYGTSAGTACQGNDSRLSDTRNTTNSVTFNNGGAGGASGSTFNGSSALTVSYNTVGAPSTTGTNASGSWGISITGSSASTTGNAATATTLQTARTIQGVSFNGSANITVVTAGTGISVSGTTVTNTGVTSVNGSTGAVSNVATTNSAQTFTAAQRGTVSALSDGATITPDFSAANNFSVTLAGNRTLANPTNITAGQSGAIVITQDATGSRTLSFGSNWKFPNGTAPTLTTTANKVDVLVYYCESASRISAQLLSNLGG